MTDSAPPASVQRVIRMALLAGILTLGAAALVIRSTGQEGAELGSDSPLAIASMGLVILAAFGVILFRRMLDASGDAARRFRLALAGLAVCEAACLLGGVVFLLGGPWLPYVAGVCLFLIGLLWLPVSAD